MKKKMIDQMNAEFIKACAEFKPVEPIKPIWKICYDKKSGKILDIICGENSTKFNCSYIIVEEAIAHAVSVIPSEYRVREETLFRATISDMNILQLDKIVTGRYKTLKDDMIFIDINGEDTYD